jgi:dolichol-phosphate hexosyltransferase
MYNPKSTVQIILAALNEEHGIACTIKELDTYLENSRIIVVDGNSVDKTAQVARMLGTDVLFQKRTGKGDALNLGLKSIDETAKYIVLSDADYTYPAEFIPKMIKTLEGNPKIGMVCGNRFNSDYPLEGMKGVFHIGNILIATMHSIFTGVTLKDPLTGLRVIRAEILRDWTPLSAKFDIEVELNVYVSNQGYDVAEIPISYRPRIGEKKLKVKDGASIFFRILTESFR